jgi:hypothetical protein
LGEVILGGHTLRFVRQSDGGDDAEPTEGRTTEDAAEEDCVEAVVCGEGNEAVEVENGDENAATNAKTGAKMVKYMVACGRNIDREEEKTLTRHPPEVPYDRARAEVLPVEFGRVPWHDAIRRLPAAGH